LKLEERKSTSERVLFKPYPKQEEFIEAVFSGDYSFLVYGGAMGGGKSYLCLATLILLARIYPKSKWCVIRESIPTLKSTTLETFKKVVPRRFIHKENQQDHIFTFKNGSEIKFMAEDYKNDKDFDRFKGLEVNGFLLEQIEELQEGLIDVCTIRAGRHKITGVDSHGVQLKQPKPIIMANMNPTLAWPKKKIYDPWSKGLLPKDWKYIPAKITDNPALADDVDYMSRFATLDDLTRRRMIDGDWTAFGVDKPFLYSFSMIKHVTTEKYVPNPHLPLWLSFDFNKDPMTCSIAQGLTIHKLVVFDQIKMPDGSTPEVCDQILARYPQFKFNMKVTGDSTGRNRTPLVAGNINHYTIIKQKLQLKDSDLMVQEKNKELSASRVLCNSILQHAEVRVTDNCEDLIADCIYSAVDSDGDLIKTQQEGRHFLDNFRYLIEAYYPDFLNKPHLYKKK
jgi:hypothetical protein